MTCNVSDPFTRDVSFKQIYITTIKYSTSANTLLFVPHEPCAFVTCLKAPIHERACSPSRSHQTRRHARGSPHTVRTFDEPQLCRARRKLTARMDFNQTIALVGGYLLIDEEVRVDKRSWTKKWLAKRAQYSHINLLRELKLCEPVDFQNYLRMDNDFFHSLLNMVNPLIKEKIE